MTPSTSIASTARQFLSFIWADQEGWFELAPKPDQRKHYSKADALNSLEGKCFFAPLARRQPRSRKVDVATQGNVLWADIDSLDGLDRVRERLHPLGISPSVIVFSGQKGYWVYLKLSKPVATAQIERLNKGLAHLLEADSCWNCDRIARVPGSVHEKSGQQVTIVDFSASIYEPEELELLAQAIPVHRLEASCSTEAEVPADSLRFPVPRLNQAYWRYINDRPAKGGAYDRSQVEQGIFLALVGQEWSDEQVIAFANAYRLSKHLQEYAKRRNYSWTLGSIAKAREHLTHQVTASTDPSIGSMCKQSRTWAATSLSYGYPPNAPLVATTLVELVIAIWDVTLANYPEAFVRWPASTRPTTFIGRRPARRINF